MALGATIAVDGRPDDELATATWVEVHERAGAPTTFRLRYEMDVSQGDLSQLVDARLGPGSTLAVLVASGGLTQCLVKGPVHGQSIHLEQGGAGSYVEVRGADTSSAMDREARSAVWDGVTDADAVSAVVGRHGYVADVDSTSSRHSEDGHVLVQRESDLRFVRRLARRNGFLFWISADAQGIETAHFKQPPLGGSPSATLAINQSPPKVLSFEVHWDVERPTSVEASQVDLLTKQDVDGDVATSPLPALAAQALDAITGDTRSTLLAAPADDAGDLQARAGGALIEALWFIRARCQAQLDALGALVRAHTVVQVDGAGSRHGGRYFVSGVRHLLDLNRHSMEIELARNAWEK